MASTDVISSPDKLSFTSSSNMDTDTEFLKPLKSKPKPKLNIKILNSNKSEKTESSAMDITTGTSSMTNELSGFTAAMSTSHLSSSTTTSSSSSNHMSTSSPTNNTMINSNSPLPNTITTSTTTTTTNNSSNTKNDTNTTTNNTTTIDSMVSSYLKNKNLNLDLEANYVPSKTYSKKMKQANKVLLPLSIKRTRDLQPSCSSATIPPKKHFFELQTSNLNVVDALSPESPPNKEYPLGRDKKKAMEKEGGRPSLVIGDAEDQKGGKKSSIAEEYYGTSLAADLMQQQKQSKDSESILTASEPYKYGPICILPYLYLGCEENAADKNILDDLNIGALLNVAYEVNNPFIMSFLKEDSNALIKNSKITDDEIDIEMIYDENAVIEIDHKWSTEVDDEFDKEEEKRKFISKSEMSTVEAIRDLSASLKRNIRYKKFYWHHNQDHLSKYFDKAFDFINESRNKKRAVLVSCQQGVSRSASLIIAYIMKTLHLNVAQAYAFVKLRNPHISPNLNLMNQLTEFEKILFQNTNGFNASSASSSNSTTTPYIAKNNLLYKDFQKL